MEVALHYTEVEVEETWGVWYLPLVLKFYSADPLAVSMVFKPVDSEEVLWQVSREMLYESLEGPVGAGGVMMWPQDSSMTRIAISLESEGHRISMSVHASELETFLEQSEQLVASGDEGDTVSAAIERFLADLI